MSERERERERGFADEQHAYTQNVEEKYALSHRSESERTDLHSVLDGQGM